MNRPRVRALADSASAHESSDHREHRADQCEHDDPDREHPRDRRVAERLTEAHRALVGLPPQVAGDQLVTGELFNVLLERPEDLLGQ